MVNYLLILFTLMTNIALASGLDKTQDVANPLDLLSNSAPENCNDMSDTEQEDDEETIDFTRSVDAAANEPLNVALSKKRQLENPDDNLNPQKRAKKSEKKYKCTYVDCDYKTNSLNRFEVHVCRHTGEKRYKCTHEGCNFGAKKLSKLTNHLRTHTGEKPFKCNYPNCKFTTAQESRLKNHRLRKHMDKKPYKCNYKNCSFAYAVLDDLKHHKKSHNKEKTFTCDYTACNFSTTENSSLIEHIRTHTGEKPLACNYEGCTFVTAHQASLWRHKKRIHKNKTMNNSSNKSAVINLLINAGKSKNN